MEGAGHASLRAVIRDRAGSAVIGRRLMLQAVRGLARLLARLTVRVLWIGLLGGVLVVAAPVTVVGVASAGAAWLRGWPPGRLYRAAAWSLPMVAAWLAAIAIRDRAGPPEMWHLIAAGSVARAVVVIAPAAIPLGLVAGGAAWSYRLRAMAAAAGGASPGSAVSFDRRQWRHQVRAARARIAVPGSVPLTTRAGDVVAGSVIRAVGHPAAELARLPYARLRSHQVVIGGTGTGKISAAPLLAGVLAH